MLRRLLRVLAEPVPLRFLLLRALDRRLDFLDYRWKLNLGSVPYPEYGYGLLNAALLAKRLGHARVAAIEFGVAGGNGLVALEHHAARVAAETGVQVAVFGFDTGTGMPPPCDHRDMPYRWQGGYYRMDRERLASRLRAAELVIGEVARTVPEFCRRPALPPVGFVAFDLDYWSSTRTALHLFDAPAERLLPRVACYFDDIVGDLESAHNEFAGVRLAIAEFNAAHAMRRLAQVRGLRFYGPRIPRLWHEQIFVAHLFDHPDYARPLNELTEMPLSDGPAPDAVWTRV